MITIKLRPRKVTSMHYSFFVSLPHIWLDHHDISKGDMVELAMGENGELILRPLGK